MAREFHVDHHRGGERESRAWDAAIAVIAARQHGVIGRRQLPPAGMVTSRRMRIDGDPLAAQLRALLA
jgi:hypothetical protein